MISSKWKLPVFIYGDFKESFCSYSSSLVLISTGSFKVTSGSVACIFSDYFADLFLIKTSLLSFIFNLYFHSFFELSN